MLRTAALGVKDRSGHRGENYLLKMKVVNSSQILAERDLKVGKVGSFGLVACLVNFRSIYHLSNSKPIKHIVRSSSRLNATPVIF